MRSLLPCLMIFSLIHAEAQVGVYDKYRPLLENPRITGLIAMPDTMGNRNYANWSIAEKDSLLAYLERLETDQDLPPITVPPWPLSTESVVQIYLATVAHTLFIEANRLVAWSLLDYPESQLGNIFAQRFAYYTSSHQWSLPGKYVLNWTPHTIYKFMRSHGFIGQDQRTTAMLFADWCRTHLGHAGGSETPANIYGYDGPVPPLDRILEGYSLVPGREYLVFGCHCTSSIWTEVMQTLNIPVAHQFLAFGYFGNPTPSYHSAFNLPSLGIGVTHGDDFYNGDVNTLSGDIGHVIPTDSLFASNQWLSQYVWSPTKLDSGVSGNNDANQQALFNSTRRLIALEVQYLADGLLRLRASDGDSSVYPTSLMDHLTGIQTGGITLVYAKPFFEEPTRDSIWLAVDRRIASLGGGNWRVGVDSVLARVNRQNLPVRISKFLATYLGSKSVRLDWSTARETNNKGFVVERAAGLDSAFQELSGSFVPGHGTTESPSEYNYVDTTLITGDWRYRLKQIDQTDSVSVTAPIQISVLVTHVQSNMPDMFRLLQNYPNPFNPVTVVGYTLPKKSHVTLTVYNVLGQIVRELVNGEIEPGFHEVSFDASGLASGVYLYRMRAGTFVESKKLMVVR